MARAASAKAGLPTCSRRRNNQREALALPSKVDGMSYVPALLTQLGP